MSTLLPSEVYFLAEDTPISILPRQSFEELDLMGTHVPALRAMNQTQVPLWIALILKKQSRCSIVIPEWLREDSLRSLVDQESTTRDRFTPLPYHWLEISQSLLANASEDLDGPAHVIRTLLREIQEVRRAKAREGLAQLDDTYAQLDEFSLMEINEIRPFVVGVMDAMKKAREPEDP